MTTYTFEVRVTLDDDREGYAYVSTVAGPVKNVEISINLPDGTVSGYADLGSAILGHVLDAEDGGR